MSVKKIRHLCAKVFFLSLVLTIALEVSGCAREELITSNSAQPRKADIIDDYQSFNKSFKAEHGGHHRPGYVCSIYFSSIIPAGTDEQNVYAVLVTRGGAKENLQALNKKRYRFIKKEGYLSTFVLNVYVQYTAEKKVQSLYCNEGYKAL